MYKYPEQRHRVFLEENQELFLKIRDTIGRALTNTGALTISHAMDGCTGSSWDMLACIDRLEELEEIDILRTKRSTQEWIIIAH